MIKSVYICHTFGKTGSTRFTNSTAKVNSKTENNGTIIYTVTSPSCFLLHMYICNKLRCKVLVNYLLTDPNGSPTTRKATSSSSAPLNISSEICNENIIHVQRNDFFFFSFQITALSYKN